MHRSGSRVILASGSPRRIELLNRIGLDVIVRPSSFDESRVVAECPIEFALQAAGGKAGEVYNRIPVPERDSIAVVGVDTVVHLRDLLLFKPRDQEDARRILRRLAGNAHQVTSAFCILHGRYPEVGGSATTRVWMEEMTDDDILHYIATGEPMDKAGAYGIQGEGVRWVRKIEGDYFNVMGLPIAALITELTKMITLPPLKTLFPPEKFRESTTQ